MLEQSTRCGLRTAPGLAESPSVTVPVTLGAWHPFVLLPTAWRAWSDEKIQAVLAHELSHVVRKDALTRALAAIHRSVFWFSPLAWWLERHLAVLAEQASDDAALGTGADRIFYANVLLGFYHDLQSTPGRVRWEGVAMTRGKQARERVERILDSSRRLSAGLRKSAWGALALLAVPLIYLPAGAQPIFAPKPHADERRALVAPVIRPAVESRYAELQAPPAGPPAPASPATPAAPKAAPAATPGPKSPTPPPATAGEWKYPESDEDVMIFYGQSMSGTGIYRDPDLDHLRALRRASNGDIVWFRRDGKAYIIRDAATVQQAKSIWDGNDLLNKVQELRRQQDAPGVPAPELTDQLKRLKQELTQEMRRQQDAPSVLTDELRKAQTQLDQLQKGAANQEELGGLQHTLRDLREKLAIGKMDAIGGKQGELGALQEQLGKEQEKLAEQQEVLGGLQDTLRDLQEKLATGKMEPNGSKLGDLGVRQEFLGKALEELRERARTATLRRMKQLLDNALAKGLAQPE
jgi:molybdopterin converting factor small subunit